MIISQHPDRFNIYAVSLDEDVKYIGVTTIGVSGRWLQHIYHANANAPMRMAEAIREFGHERFTVEHIASSVDRVSMLETELILIKQYGTDVTGYNRQPGRKPIGLQAQTATERSARRRTRETQLFEEAATCLAEFPVGTKQWACGEALSEIIKRRLK